MATDTESREARIARLRHELAEAEGETAEEFVEAIGDAEAAVEEVAQDVTEATVESHEDVHEAAQEVEEAVEEEAREAADAVGHPELAGEIADHLFRRLHDEGLLPHTQHHEVSPVAEAEEAVETVAEAPAEVVSEGAKEAEQVTQDVAPEPTHWFYRRRGR